MVHSVGGTLIKHLEEHQIQGNRKPDDVLMYYTTTGWMMWNWMVTALTLGKTLERWPHAEALHELMQLRYITLLRNFL